MPAITDILQYMRGQLFQTPQLPTQSFGGKTVVVTGANSGLGLECAKQLIELNVSTLILAVRDLDAGESAKKKLSSGKKHTTDVRVWYLDMADYSSVKAFAARVSSEIARLDALVANAGISRNKYTQAEGLELTLTVNVVSTFLLALLCLPKLQQSSAMAHSPSHLTITGSVVHCFADPSQMEQPQRGKVLSTLSADKNMAGRYFLSKLIVIICVRKLAKQITLREKATEGSVILNCPNPGWCKTPLFREDDGGAFARMLLKLIGRTAESGARTLTSAIAAGSETHGQYLSECQVKKASVWMRSAESQETQIEMWEEMVDTLEKISSGSCLGFK